MTSTGADGVIRAAGVRIGGAAGTPGGSAGLPPVRSYDPATGRVAGEVDPADAADSLRAVGVADSSLPAWSRATDRADRLRAIATWLRSGPADLAALITLETGKRIAESRAELALSAGFFDYYADVLDGAAPQRIQAVPGTSHLVRQQPLGVVAVVTPWNFPVSIPARKIAPALAAGCPVVFKPSEVAPLSGLALAEGLERLLPAGVVNTVVGDGIEICGAWLDDERVRGMTFTGSTRLGTALAAQAAPTLTRMVLELGGNSPFVVLDDAGADTELDRAVDTLMVAKYRNNGQSCIAASQVFVPAALTDRFVERLLDRSSALALGDPADEATDLGPMALAGDPDRLADLAADAADTGAAEVLTAAVAVPERGFFAPPRIVVRPGPAAGVCREEVFGPISVIRPYADLNDVLDDVRSGPVGLGGYVCGRDADRAVEVAQQLDVGIVGVNTGAPNTPQVAFAGRKLSGYGVEGSRAGFDEFCTYQTVATGGVGT